MSPSPSPSAHQRIPERRRIGRFAIEFEAVLTRISRAGDQNLTPRQVLVTRPVIGDGGEVPSARNQFRENEFRLGALQGKQARLVAHVFERAVLGVVGSHPFPVLFDVRRVHDGHVALLIEPVDREVVHDTARLPAHGRIEDAANFEPADVVRDHLVDESARFSPARLELAHVAHVEEAGGFPHRTVLFDDARVLDGHLIAREWHHLRACGLVGFIQGGSAEFLVCIRHDNLT